MTRTLAALIVVAGVLSAQPEQDVRRAITRTLPRLESSAAAFVAKRACVSCHHNTLTVVTFHAARDRGFKIDPAVLTAVEDKTFRELRGASALDDAAQSAAFADPTPNESMLLVAAGAAGVPPGLVPAIYARRMASWQRDGHWTTSDFRPPHSSSAFTATATAVRAIRLYLWPPESRAERDACIARAIQWLAATSPASTEDAAFRLLGLVWAGADGSALATAQRDLLALQLASGGWPQLPGYSADAYSTGEALYALHESGAPAVAASKKALKFLISTQAADGTWRVHTRMLSPADVSPKYFTTGFPYEKDEYLSYAGSCWAVMALLGVFPETNPPPPPAPLPEDAPAWVRTALFGSARELTALLDGGLDPNSTTKNGTTLMMLAAPSAEKVRLLLSRSAPSARALTIATSYGGTAESIRALLESGPGAAAELNAPKGQRARNTPLVNASMAGDLENVKLLLAHGADPSAPSQSNTPLSAAITFGRADVVETLIAAGASTGLTESTGINLLHWAAIANRPAVIPLLAAAKVPINALDDYGYTPLMYAATIDFGDTAVADALLKAGADRKIKNDAGRTPLEQARHLHHTHLEARLR